MTTLPDSLSMHRATGIDSLDTRTFYRIAQLRERVFVVEQACPYLELDGRDLEPETVQIWAATDTGEIAATVRVLSGRTHDPHHPFAERTAAEAAAAASAAQTSGQTPKQQDRVIGRVVTAADWRGSGVATALMHEAITACEGAAIELDAQSHLTGWYAKFGFTPNGPEYVEDGIPHTPMRREPS